MYIALDLTSKRSPSAYAIMCVCECIYTHIRMYADRQRDKTVERQTDRETEGQRDRETDRQTRTQPVLRKIAISPRNDVCVCVCVCTYIHTYMQTNRETKGQREPARHVPSKMSPSAHTKVPTPSNILNLNMPWYINTHTHTHTHTHKRTYTHTHIHTYTHILRLNMP